MRNVSIDVELNGLPVGQVTTMVEKLPSLQALPPGVIRQSSGDAERMAELFGGFGGAMLIGVLLISNRPIPKIPLPKVNKTISWCTQIRKLNR